MTHYLGEYIFSKSTNTKDGIEICSRKLLGKAPLHGFVWAAVITYAENLFPDTSDFLQINWSQDQLTDFAEYINNEICYFRSEANMSHIYRSCSFLRILNISYYINIQ